MTNKLPTHVSIETAILSRQLPSGLVLAAPVADSTLVARGSEAEVLETQRRFLSKYLISVQPDTLARFCAPAATSLREVEVVLRRHDLPKRLQMRMPVVFACILIAQKRDTWVIVPDIEHTFFVHRREALDEVIRREIARVVGANEYSGTRYLRLFPPEDTSLSRLQVTLEHEGQGIQGRAGALRKKIIADKRRKLALKTIRTIAVPMNKRVPEVTPTLIARDREVARLSALMSGSQRRSVLLVGAESSGKSALVHEWIARTWPRRGRRSDNVPVYATSAAQFMAGMSGFGEWQERVENVMRAAEELDAVLYFENLAELFGERTERGGAGVAGLMRKYVIEGRVRILGEIDTKALDMAESRHVAMLGAFNRIRIPALDARQTVEALDARIEWWHTVQPEMPRIQSEVCSSVVELAERYMPYRAFPGKAVRFVEELRATANPARDDQGQPVTIGLERVYEGFALATGIPSFLLRDDRSLMVERVIEEFRGRMVGQDEAVRRVVETLCVVKARLQPAGKPLCTLLFVGPTGVGKTELARTLARFLFRSTDRMVRFDMSEYTDSLAAERLIRGTQSDDGLLTSKVREQPFCVLLLDEIEKAHPSVFDLLLQVCGEGRLTDARGKTAYFHNAIIIMTSNLGAVHKRGALGIGARPLGERDRYMAAVHAAFRPEFINRLDRVIAFGELAPEEVRAVTRIAVERIKERRGIAGAGVALEVSERAMDMFARGGFSQTYGVRALRRHLDEYLVAPVSRLLARVGPEAKGSLIVVSDRDEHAEIDDTSPKSLIAGDTHGQLRFELYRRSATVGRRALRGIAGLADLRRNVDWYMSLERVVEIKERLDLIRSQLATAGNKRRKNNKRRDIDITALEIEFHRLNKLYCQADAMREDMHAAEEFGLSALFEGQNADEWTNEARTIYTRFRQQLFWLLMARTESRDQITLLISDLQGANIHRFWLGPLLRELPKRRWTLSAHVHGQPNKGEEWPVARIWTPPRDAAWVRSNIIDGKHPHRDVLLRIRGPEAAVLLGLEVGLHRFLGFDSRHDPATMTVSLVALRTVFTDKEWLASILSERGASTVSDRGTAARERFAGSDEIRILGKQRRVYIPRAAYWQRIEEVALEHLLHYVEAAHDSDDEDSDTLYAGALPTMMPTEAEEQADSDQ